MNNPTNSTNVGSGTFGQMESVDDFLPKPEDLVYKSKDLTKVTLLLNKSDVAFFKQEAKRLGGNYQTMIRNLISHYTYSKSTKIS